MDQVKVGILGAGNIAGVMAQTIVRMRDAQLWAVGSRSLSKAEAFAEQYRIGRSYGSYEELAADPDVDLIYIATPHSEHYAHAKLCLEHGKAVLCEKAFTANAAQAEELVRIAREKRILLAEAIWTRYMPMLGTIREVLASGVIGQPVTLTANLGYVIDDVKRMTDPALAGGALLDLGVYPVNFASMILGTQVKEVHSSCVFSDTGVDRQNSITLLYEDGKMAVLYSSMSSLSDRRGVIGCSAGYAVVKDINNFESLAVYDLSDRQIGYYERPEQISGYEYEVEACVDALRKGRIECEAMPHKEILRVMRLLDEIRGQWGMKYPFE